MHPTHTFFDDHPRLRAVIDAVLEGGQGSVRTLAATPRAARLDLGCYAVPGGDPGSAEARALLEELRGPVEIVVPDDDRWRALIDEVFGDRVYDRSMKAYVGLALDHDRLSSLVAGLELEYSLTGVGKREAASLVGGFVPNGVAVFGGPERYAEGAFGVCAMRNGCPICAATVYALSSDKAEVAIVTREDHRGKGLATSVAAAMLLECVRRGKTPHWNAFNPVSQRLALRLGLSPDGVCEIRMLDG